MYKKKRIKYKGVNYYLNVFTYENGRIGLKLENKSGDIDISIDLPDCCLEGEHIFLNPDVRSNNSLYKLLRKCKLIKDVSSVIMFDYNPIPVTKVNLRKLEEYDYDGVTGYLSLKHSEGFIE